MSSRARQTRIQRRLDRVTYPHCLKGWKTKQDREAIRRLYKTSVMQGLLVNLSLAFRKQYKDLLIRGAHLQ